MEPITIADVQPCISVNDIDTDLLLHLERQLLGEYEVLAKIEMQKLKLRSKHFPSPMKDEHYAHPTIVLQMDMLLPQSRHISD